ncbi:MAG: flavodoxin-dependent (E)-4-hydroxy-3-methylbut-2-enyl-diphosphate synthase [Proteobacteria bacterium]|nr:flavodoxin-dependent (E)-4-hydroxy-3-methylbut-2-enyl-diphosphate synthase [Pseudomonadota bacterium]MBU1583906.1 flavodoxin-dependent (E)-4-hydroxy-3-methylbut-2-enyl-diphosphate synthase [Pseudomonadota bacterium]MBU2452809.1 flavodoxin-dependent (E)-4-hydroxy-3-methylbut-2-enyl-diphosphate synthase [Pseudomonadota bacterium]MBU2628013.1 flavodoxin-dependent (E)-4-hydroxy-3-methylbut-2-enyl-diphosphate synthase [Pseudomonadota bacterium]
MSLVQERRPTRQISIGKVKIGSKSPVSVQSMTNTQTQDVAATVRQILSLEKAGCEIIRVAVPDMEAALAIKKIKEQITIPLIADIHFDFRLALASAKAGADALRINPGNIGEAKKIRAVVACAKDHDIPIRIGVNAGSLEKEIEQRLGTTAEAMVESALRNIQILEDLDFYNIKVSLKASDVSRTVTAYRLLAPKTTVPFHVGVTEAGGLYAGITKSAIGIGMLLAEGLGDTLRVSLTRDPVEEIRTGYEILRALGIRSRGPELISCPTCGRCKIDLFKIAEEIEKALLEQSSQIKVAIMGCVVNGPGEAKEADIGIAGGDGMGILFKKGKVIRKIDQDKLVDQLLDEIDNMTKNSEEVNGKKE